LGDVTSYYFEDFANWFLPSLVFVWCNRIWSPTR